MPNIRGLQRLSLIDYPGEIAAVIFLASCNFRCRFCHNSKLVLNPESLEKIEEKDLMDFLCKRKGKLDAVVVSGGEPCINKDLPIFLKKIKSKGYLVKLDTNGSIPSVLEKCLPYVDYIAMDIKSNENNYEKIVGVKIDFQKIKQSIDLIKNSGKIIEFRTTIIPKEHSKKVVKDILKLIGKGERYSVQEFKKGDIIEPKLNDTKKFTIKEINDIKEEAKKYFELVKVS